MLRQAADHQLIVFFFASHSHGWPFTCRAIRVRSSPSRRNGHIRRSRVAGDLALGATTVFCGIRVKGQIDIANQILPAHDSRGGIWLGGCCVTKHFSIFGKSVVPVYSCCVNRAMQNLHLFNVKHGIAVIFVNTRGTKCPRPDAKLVDCDPCSIY